MGVYRTGYDGEHRLRAELDLRARPGRKLGSKTTKNLGYFSSELAAAVAYARALKEHEASEAAAAGAGTVAAHVSNGTGSSEAPAVASFANTVVR